MKKENPRMDVATRGRYEKDRLFRLVVQDGALILDENSSLPGRGIYLLKEESSVLLAKKRHLLSRYGNVGNEDEFYEKLLFLLREGGNGNG